MCTLSHHSERRRKELSRVTLTFLGGFQKLLETGFTVLWPVAFSGSSLGKMGWRSAPSALIDGQFEPPVRLGHIDDFHIEGNNSVAVPHPKIVHTPEVILRERDHPNNGTHVNIVKFKLFPHDPRPQLKGACGVDVKLEAKRFFFVKMGMHHLKTAQNVGVSPQVLDVLNVVLLYELSPFP